MVLKNIDVLSAGKMLGCLYGLLALIAGLVISALALLVGLGNPGGAGGFEAMFLGAGAVIILPLVYGTSGFIGGVIMAVFYNITAGIVGGIKMEFVRPTDETI